MRLRFAVRWSLLVALVMAAAPAVSGAAPVHNHGLTINATPNPIIAGEGVLIYGQLNAAPLADQTIILYHHVSGLRRGFTPIGETTTDSHGFYEFPRAEGIVETNRVRVTLLYRWFPECFIGGPLTMSAITEIPVAF